MKTFAAVAVAALVSAGCVVPVAGPGYYETSPIYGQVEIGNYPPPLVYNRPVLVAPPRHVVPPPVYLHVPPPHHQNWNQHCGRYNACGRPSYFIRDPVPGRHYRRL